MSNWHASKMTRESNSHIRSTTEEAGGYEEKLEETMSWGLRVGGGTYAAEDTAAIGSLSWKRVAGHLSGGVSPRTQED